MNPRFRQFTNSALILPQYLFAGTVLLFSTSVFAFGGGSGGGKTMFDENIEKGFSSMGVYWNGGSQADINFQSCGSNQVVYNGVCTDICQMANYNSECQVCSVVNKKAVINNKVNVTCGTGGNYICSGGSCINPCSLETHVADACISGWSAVGGQCQPTYSSGTSCGTNGTCSEGICRCDTSVYTLNTEPDASKCIYTECSAVNGTYYKITGCKTGFHLNAGHTACLQDAPEDNYCMHTDSNGKCIEWGYCAYEHSGEAIIGVPDADGGCAPDSDHRVVCLDTNAEGVCEGWGEPCRKDDEYHDIIGTPSARSFCCDVGTSHCEYVNDNDDCVLWDCGYSCSAETSWQHCNRLECEAKGSHFTFDRRFRNGCHCTTGYTGTNCDDCVSPSYIKNAQGDCVLHCDDAHTGDYCYQCAPDYRPTANQPEGAGETTPYNCELKCTSEHLGTCTAEECIALGFTYSPTLGCIQLECVNNTNCGEYEVCKENHCVSKCNDDEFADLGGTCRKCTLDDGVSATPAQCDSCGEKRFSVNSERENVVMCQPQPDGCVMNDERTQCNCPDGQRDKGGICCPIGYKGERCDECDDNFEPVNGQCVIECVPWLERDANGNCTICTNGLTYLPQNVGRECDAFDGNCRTNDDCADGQYCQLTGEWLLDGNGHQLTPCGVITAGTCTDIGHYTDKTTANHKMARKSDSAMSWWSADNWCKAQGMNLNLITLKQLACYQSGSPTLVKDGSSYEGGCCAKNKTCTANENWYTDDEKANFSSVLRKLGHADEHFWTAYSDTDACYAFTISTADAKIDHAPKSLAEKRALCYGCVEGYEEVDGNCVEKCAAGITRNADGSCTVCENGNVYFSNVQYPDLPCETETVMNQKTCETDADCTDNRKPYGENCCDTETHICKAGFWGPGYYQCPETGTPCTSNLDCEPNTEFCNIEGSAGTCAPIGEYTDSWQEIAGLGIVRKSNQTLTWWSAENWCKAQEMRPVKVSDLTCYESGTSTPKLHFNGSGKCCKEGTVCDATTSYPDYENTSSVLTDMTSSVSCYSNESLWIDSPDGDATVYCQSLDIATYNTPGDTMTAKAVCTPTLSYQCDPEYLSKTGLCADYCPEGLSRAANGACTICANGNVYLPYAYISDRCSTNVTGDCVSNDDCAAVDGCANGTCYCQLDSSGDNQMTGTCVVIGSHTDSSAEDNITKLLGSPARMSQNSMNWWSAWNWCQAQKRADGTAMRLMDLASLQCYQSGTDSPLLTLNSETHCCASGQTCTSWYNKWEDGVMNPEDAELYSPVAVALVEAFGRDPLFWLRDVRSSSVGIDFGTWDGMLARELFLNRTYKALCQ